VVPGHGGKRVRAPLVPSLSPLEDQQGGGREGGGLAPRVVGTLDRWQGGRGGACPSRGGGWGSPGPHTDPNPFPRFGGLISCKLMRMRFGERSMSSERFERLLKEFVGSEWGTRPRDTIPLGSDPHPKRTGRGAPVTPPEWRPPCGVRPTLRIREMGGSRQRAVRGASEAGGVGRPCGQGPTGAPGDGGGGDGDHSTRDAGARGRPSPPGGGQGGLEQASF